MDNNINRFHINNNIQIFLNGGLTLEIKYTKELKDSLIDWYISNSTEPRILDDIDGGLVFFTKDNIVLLRFPQE